MFGIFTGVIVDTLAIVAGTALGLMFKTKTLQRIGDRLFQVFALFVIIMGVSGSIKLPNTYLIMGSLIAGTALGEAVDLDKQFTRLGNFMEQRFTKSGQEGSTFAKGFIQASLLFCVGSMAVVGALQSGLDNDHSVMYTKAILDGLGAATLTMGFGISVGFAALLVLIYEGILTAGAGVLGPILAPDIVAVSSTVGNMLLVGMGLNMLTNINLKLANFLPAIFVPMVYQAIVLLIR